MDRPRLSASSIEELTALFREALRENAVQLATSDLDGIEQRLQDIARSVFGPVVEETIMAIAATLPSGPPECPPVPPDNAPGRVRAAPQLAGAGR